ncbi:MAG: HEAT repeat domain-containing protein, partial [Acidobacteriota bacterium]
SEPVISAVLGALDGPPRLRATAVDVLAQLYGAESGEGRAPAEVLDRLTEAASDPDENVQAAVIRALGDLGAGSESVHALLRVFADGEHPSLRLRAESALLRLDAAEKGAGGESRD